MHEGDSETCVVRLEVVRARRLGRWDWRLVAVRGQEVIAVSPVVQARPVGVRWGLHRVSSRALPSPEILAGALEGLTAQLVRDGWERTADPRESAWLLRAFCRPAGR